MEIKACIFDLDGVIVDTARYHYLAWREIAHELNFEFTPEHNEGLKGVSRMRSLEILLQVGGLSFDEETKIRLAERKNNIYRQYIMNLTPDDILPGAGKFLLGLRKHHIKMALGSASKNAMFILEKLEMTSLFDAIIDGNSVTKAKPDPEIFLKGAKALGIPAKNCVVFEDAETGVDAALAAGMGCVGVGNPGILRNAHWVVPGFEGLSYEKLIINCSMYQ